MFVHIDDFSSNRKPFFTCITRSSMYPCLQTRVDNVLDFVKEWVFCANSILHVCFSVWYMNAMQVSDIETIFKNIGHLKIHVFV